jgi:hypothetical protein
LHCFCRLVRVTDAARDARLGLGESVATYNAKLYFSPLSLKVAAAARASTDTPSSFWSLAA